VQATLNEFCNGYKIQLAGEPQLFPLSRHTWFLEDTSGKQWVAKARLADDNTVEIFKAFSVLHPPFHYPQPISDPQDPYLLYPYIRGKLLADELFELPEIIEQVMEGIGRLQALMRSLVLASYFQETLDQKGVELDSIDDLADRFRLGKIQARSDRQKLARQKEIAECYRWTENKIQICCEFIKSRGLWPRAPLDQFRDLVHRNSSLHLPIMGNNLAHCALRPEHLLLCSGNRLGIVGWHVEPRPRFYMTYNYLAWSFLHSKQPDPMDFYRKYLAQNSNRAFPKEHYLVFALCLLEQLTQFTQRTSPNTPLPPTQRLQQAEEFFTECVRNVVELMKSQQGWGLNLND
jgi:hypothetical protein